MTQRIERYGQWMGKIGENIDFGSTEPVEVVISFLVDDGVSSRGHRKNLLSQDFRYIGIGSHSHSSEKLCCVLDFASEYS